MIEEVVQKEVSILKVYPGIFDRIKAIVVDSFVIMAFLVLATIVFSYFKNAPDHFRIITFLFIFLFYDPIFTSIFGGTIGHAINGLRVKRERDQTRNISFPKAIIRFISKALIGWVSLITVSTSKKNKAIHDFLVGSVVIYNK